MRTEIYVAKEFGEAGDVWEAAQPGTMKWRLFEHCLSRGVSFSLNQLEKLIAAAGGPMLFFLNELDFEWREYREYQNFFSQLRNLRLKADQRKRKKIMSGGQECRVRVM